MTNINYAKRSLIGLWIGDSIGNLGNLYNVHDVLKALDGGINKFGKNLVQFHGQFQYSDDTEEAIVLHNHLMKRKDKKGTEILIDQNKLAMEFATRYYEKDPDGEKYGYGLMTRKVLRDIYDGTPWNEANKTKPHIEGPSFVDKMIAGVTEGKTIHRSMSEVNAEMKEKARKDPNLKVGSFGNGSAMRVAPLGAFIQQNYIEDNIDNLKVGSYNNRKKVFVEASLQAEVTHCHPEGIAGAIAIAELSRLITKNVIEGDIVVMQHIFSLLNAVPESRVKEGIRRIILLKSDLNDFDVPLQRVIELLGNGTHVTCQDTVPLCCYLTLKHLTLNDKENMYENAIIETAKCFGDVDTNCAIVGGMVGIVADPPKKWVEFCNPMEDVVE